MSEDDSLKPPCDAFVANTLNEVTLWKKVREVTEMAINSAYGTDPRHNLIAIAVADEVAMGVGMPWSLPKHFGRDVPYSEELKERAASTELQGPGGNS